MSTLGEYAAKAVKAGVVLVRLMEFLKTTEQTVELNREEVEAIIMLIREQATDIKLRKIKEKQQ